MVNKSWSHPLKYKWDNKNVLDYTIAEAVKEADAIARKEEQMKLAEKINSIVLKLLKHGMSADRISRCTKLSIEEIEKLKSLITEN